MQIEYVAGKQLLSADPNVPLDLSPIGPGQSRVFLLPSQMLAATLQLPKAWRVTSDFPVQAFQFNPYETSSIYSSDAAMLLPSAVLGDYYIVLSRAATVLKLPGFLTVVATQGRPTNVSVTFSATSAKTLSSKDGKITSFNSGESAKFSLEKYDTLNIETDSIGGDLTGTTIVSDGKVAVFSGNSAAFAPNSDSCNVELCPPWELKALKKCGKCAADGQTACHDSGDCTQFVTCCADHLEEQLFPVKMWDSHYVAVKLKPRGNEADLWRIVAASDGTLVTLNPPQKNPQGKAIQIPVLDKGQWYEFEVDCGIPDDVKQGSCPHGGFEVNAVHKDGSLADISLGHFMAGQDAPGPGAQSNDAGTGDPAFLLAIPRSQWSTQSVFFTPEHYSVNYISIAAPIDAVVAFDGEPVAPDLFKTISAKHKYCWLFVNPGPHTVDGFAAKKADGSPGDPVAVAVDVYGFDQYVSYGFPAGLSAK